MAALPGNGNGHNGASNGIPIPRDPTRFALWAVTGFLALLGLFFTTINGVPWAPKDAIEHLKRDVARLDRTDDAALARVGSLELSLQGLQYENRQLREQVAWLEAEIERVRIYVYPQPSGRVPRPRSGIGPIPPNALGPPRTTP